MAAPNMTAKEKMMRKTQTLISVLAAACLAVAVIPGCGAEEATDTAATETTETTDDATAAGDATDATDATEDATEATDDATDATEDATEATDDATDAADDATDATDETAVEDTEVDAELTWGLECADNADCPAPTNICAKQPGAAAGYCSTQCTSTTECHDNGAPTDTWTCNAVSCSVPAMTWCGPNSELEESNGFLSECN